MTEWIKAHEMKQQQLCCILSAISLAANIIVSLNIFYIFSDLVFKYIT